MRWTRSSSSSTPGAASPMPAERTMAIATPASEHSSVSSQPTLASTPSETAAATIASSGPPSLEYTLRTRKKAIASFWTLCLVDCIAVPIVLYFELWYHTSLSPNAVFSISTATLGTVSIFEYLLRFSRLWRKSSTCRVPGAPRFYLDWFHWVFSFAWLLIMAELIPGTIPRDPPIRVLAMPVSTMLWTFVLEFLLVDIFHAFHYRPPFRISNVPARSTLRPGIYSIIEDIIAVDGGGGTGYRERLNKRYESSRIFRLMIHRVNLFWYVGGIAIATLTTVLIWTIDREVAYVVGWTVPFAWAGLWTAITIPWVQRFLRREKEEWSDPPRLTKV